VRVACESVGAERAGNLVRGVGKRRLARDGVLVPCAALPPAATFARPRSTHFAIFHYFSAHAYQASLTLQATFIAASTAQVANATDYLKKGALEATTGLVVHWKTFASDEHEFVSEAQRLAADASKVDSIDSFNTFMDALNDVEARYITGKSLEYLADKTYWRNLFVYIASVLFILASLARAYVQYKESSARK
jgi:hypothetical protein